MRRLRLSIRYKILLIILGVLFLAMGTYLYLAATLFTRDKLAYIYDLNASLVSTLTEQTRANLGVLIKEMNIVARELGHADATVAADLFAREPDLLRVQLYARRGEPWVLQNTLVNREGLDLLQLKDEDLDHLRRERPLPLTAIASQRGYVYVQNSSLPPDAAVLTLAYRATVGNYVMVADFRHERLLRIFGRSKLHETYLIDERGEVLAHPNGARVIAHQDLSSRALVQAALSSEAAEGVREFMGEDKTPQLGAYGKVGIGRLWVLTQIPKSEALRASRELVARSALFAVAILLAAFVVSIFFSRLITAPIRRLQQAAERIGTGHFDIDVEVGSNDEIGDLASAFKRMAQALQQTQGQLVQSEKMAAFGQLGAGITHEVKNPMTSILGFAQLAQRRLDEPEKAGELMKMVEKEALRCQDILVNFLKFARTSTGDFDRLQVNDVVDEAARMLRHQLTIGGVRLEVTLAQELPAILGNAAELQQVILNLAINAQQAMPQGGQVKLQTLLTAPHAVAITVTDNGPGIPEAIRGKIFEPFFTTKAPGQGTGLGLAVSFGIIQGHKGNIEVMSEEGKGTTFTIHLPAA